jgi:hypothetical protein
MLGSGLLGRPKCFVGPASWGTLGMCPRHTRCGSAAEEEDVCRHRRKSKQPTNVCTTEARGLADVQKEPWLECSACRWGRRHKQEDEHRKKDSSFQSFVFMRSCFCQTIHKNTLASSAKLLVELLRKSNISGKVKPCQTKT